MTPAGQAILFAGEFMCLLFAVIAMMYFADRLRSDVLKRLRELSKHHHGNRRSPTPSHLSTLDN